MDTNVLYYGDNLDILRRYLPFSSAYMDYLHVARSGDAWLLLNILWQRRPGR
jgi:hypothetical protein